MLNRLKSLLRKAAISAPAVCDTIRTVPVPPNPADVTGVQFSGVQFGELSLGDLEARQLLRDATALHGEKKYDAAIERLRSAYALMLASFSDHPISVWVRLPLYLQKAGRFDEAMHEFSLLNAKIKQRERPKHLSPKQHATHNAADLIFVADKIRLATQREAKTNRGG
jgi:hypothetical protein